MSKYDGTASYYHQTSLPSSLDEMDTESLMVTRASERLKWQLSSSPRYLYASSVSRPPVQ